MAELSEVKVEHSIKKVEPATAKTEGLLPDEGEWTVCCSKSSSNFIKFSVQVTTSMSILGFAIGMIASGNNDPVYWSLITLIMGVYVPSPSLKR